MEDVDGLNPLYLQLEMLCVSQFTLYHVMKGNKPDFHLAMGGEESKLLYDQLLSGLKKGYKEDKIQNGVFGAMMQVELINDGPVTLELEAVPPSQKPDTKEKPPAAAAPEST